MKKLFLYCLFFSFASILQAQITPDGATDTQVISQSGVDLIDIATPNSNGLSNNHYSDFNIFSSGVILNNSNTGSNSQLTGDSIAGNSNITAGSEANLIINQVTSNNTSLLQGYAEIVGNKADLIIASPNGIICSGCGFINASQVSLITGISQFDSDNRLTGFNISETGKISVTGNLDAVNVDYLNLISRYHQIHASIKTNKLTRILSGNQTYDHQNQTLDSDTETINNSTINFGIDVSSQAGLEAGSIVMKATEKGLGINIEGNLNAEKITIESVSDLQLEGNTNAYEYLVIQVGADASFTGNIHSTDISIESSADANLLGDITADNTFGIFTESDAVLSGKLVATNIVIIADNYIQSGSLHSDKTTKISTTGNEYVRGLAKFDASSSITANKFSLNTGFFYNEGRLEADEALFNLGTYFGNQATGIIRVNDLNISIGENNSYSTTIISYSKYGIFLDIQYADLFENYGDIQANDFNVIATRLENHKDIIANNLNITAKESFYNDDGNITADTFTVTTESGFANNNNISANTLSITSKEYFRNTGNMIIKNLAIIAPNVNLNYPGSISADNFNIIADNLNSNSDRCCSDRIVNITAKNLSITAKTFVNFKAQTNVITNNLYISTDYFGNDGNITTDSFNFSGGRFVNDYRSSRDSATIVSNNLDISADYFSNEDSIITDNFNFNGGTFRNRSYNVLDNIISNNLDISADHFQNESHITTNNFSFNGENFVNGYPRNNYGYIRSNNLDISADYFSNYYKSTIRSNNYLGIKTHEEVIFYSNFVFLQNDQYTTGNTPYIISNIPIINLNIPNIPEIPILDSVYNHTKLGLVPEITTLPFIDRVIVSLPEESNIITDPLEELEEEKQEKIDDKIEEQNIALEENRETAVNILTEQTAAANSRQNLQARTDLRKQQRQANILENLDQKITNNLDSITIPVPTTKQDLSALNKTQRLELADIIQDNQKLLKMDFEIRRIEKIQNLNEKIEKIQKQLTKTTTKTSKEKLAEELKNLESQLATLDKAEFDSKQYKNLITQAYLEKI